MIGSNRRPSCDGDSRAGPRPEGGARLGSGPGGQPGTAASSPPDRTGCADARARTGPDPPEHTRPARAPSGTRRCEIVGVGPVPVATFRRLLGAADSSITDFDIAPVVLGPGGVPVLVGVRQRLCSHRVGERVTLPIDPRSLDLGRAQRLVSHAQWIALLARSGGTCEILGCAVAYDRCQVHHRRYWTSGGPTDLDNLMLACNHHHHTLHADFTAVPVAHTGRFQLHRPDGSVVPVPCLAAPRSTARPARPQAHSDPS